MDTRVINTIYEMKTIIRLSKNEPDAMSKFVVVHDFKKDLYTILCCNFYYKTTSMEDIVQFEKQTIDLFLEFEDYDEREWFDNVENAIKQHIIDFDG